MERIIQDALNKVNLHFEINKKNLDFYIGKYDVYIECKQFHSERILEQSSRVENLIVIQGIKAAKAFADLILGN